MPLYIIYRQTDKNNFYTIIKKLVCIAAAIVYMDSKICLLGDG
jgi:hypothetical protein